MTDFGSQFSFTKARAIVPLSRGSNGQDSYGTCSPGAIVPGLRIAQCGSNSAGSTVEERRFQRRVVSGHKRWALAPDGLESRPIGCLYNQPMPLLRIPGWLACVVYSTIPSFWLMVHPRAHVWREKESPPFRVLVPAWIVMWVGVGAL